MSNAPVLGCPGCHSTAGRSGCPQHADSIIMSQGGRICICGGLWGAEREVERLRGLGIQILIAQRERDEALAQVAAVLALLQRVRDAEDPEEYLDDLQRIEEDAGDLPARARALLGYADPQRQSCERCGRREGQNFVVADEEWQAIVPVELQPSALCLVCFDQLADEKGVNYTIQHFTFAGLRGHLNLNVRTLLNIVDRIDELRAQETSIEADDEGREILRLWVRASEWYGLKEDIASLKGEPDV